MAVSHFQNVIWKVTVIFSIVLIGPSGRQMLSRTNKTNRQIKQTVCSNNTSYEYVCMAVGCGRKLTKVKLPQGSGCVSLAARSRLLGKTLFFLKKWAIPGLFFIYFRLFKQTPQILQQIFANNYPSSFQCWDSNPRPSRPEPHPITTRPGLPPIIFICLLGHFTSFPSLSKILSQRWHNTHDYYEGLSILAVPIRYQLDPQNTYSIFKQLHPDVGSSKQIKYLGCS